MPEDRIYFQLSPNEKRFYSVRVFSDRILFEGKFWYLRDKEFYPCRTGKETASIKSYIGMGYLAKRSPKKCIAFLLGGVILEFLKAVFDQLSKWADKANEYLRWVDKSIELPGWMVYGINMMAGLCVLLGVVYLFSKKKMVEISFLEKRICVPQSSMSQTEYYHLHQKLMDLKEHPM